MNKKISEYFHAFNFDCSVYIHVKGVSDWILKLLQSYAGKATTFFSLNEFHFHAFCTEYRNERDIFWFRGRFGSNSIPLEKKTNWNKQKNLCNCKIRSYILESPFENMSWSQITSNNWVIDWIQSVLILSCDMERQRHFLQ